MKTFLFSFLLVVAIFKVDSIKSKEPPVGGGSGNCETIKDGALKSIENKGTQAYKELQAKVKGTTNPCLSNFQRQSSADSETAAAAMAKCCETPPVQSTPKACIDGAAATYKTSLDRNVASAKICLHIK